MRRTHDGGGARTIEVDDRSDIHNFRRPGLDGSTSVPATGQTTWEVTLEAGPHSFVCDPHQTSINGSFEVSG